MIPRHSHSSHGGSRGRRLVLAMTLALAASGAQAQADDAKAMLKKMSDYVRSQNVIAFTFDSDIEVVTPQLEKLQFTNSGDVLVSRPDKIRAHRVGGYAEVSLIYDGKIASIDGRSINGFAQVAIPGTLDMLFEALRSGHGVALPAADFLISNPYDALIAGVLESKHVGRGVIDGVECEHLAFRNHDTDWQLWIDAGPHPIPRKVLITSKTVNNAPQYSVRVKTWKTGFDPPPGAFTFVPPPGATQLDPNALIMLDELPPEAAPGETP